MDDKAMLERARQVLDVEAEGLALTKAAIGDGFVKAVKMLRAALEKGGKIVVSGVGKNLYIAEKFSASLASTGSTSVVMNPIQAMHGDLGILAQNDILVALSFSGESEELVRLVPAVRRLGAPVVACTGKAESTLAKLSDSVLVVSIGKEACPFGMAPTTSTTATLALLDAVAMVLLDQHDFSREAFGLLHPAGAIGRALVLRARDIMRKDSRVAKLPPESSVMDALMAMTQSQSGAAMLVNEDGTLAGIFTDGDFRRNLAAGKCDLQTPVSGLMTRSPVCAREDMFAAEVLRIFEGRKIDDLPVLSADGKLSGCIDIQDLPKLKVI